jgi:hypothetical protein
MRKAVGLNVVILIVAMVFASGTAFAGKAVTGNEAPSGQHFNINIIGHPKDYKGSGEYSGGHSIMIPLKNVGSRGELTCLDENGVVVIDDQGQTTNLEPTGARIYFEGSDHFEILDRDATDGDGARVLVPVVGDVMQFDIYMRVLGKPNTCMNINAYAYDADLNVVPDRDSLGYQKDREEHFRKVNQLTICVSWDQTTQTCLGGYRSVFDTAFETYFWTSSMMERGLYSCGFTKNRVNL